MNIFFLNILLSLYLVLVPLALCAKTQVVIRHELGIENILKGREKKFIVKADIDLNGRTVKVGKDCSFDFRGGSFSNGTIIGEKTIVYSTQKNVFHNCLIIGDWQGDAAYSTMFDNELDALILLKNMSCLSPVLRLSANREYHINTSGESIDAEIIESAGIEKPLIVFHTTNPNVTGLIIKGINVKLRNLIISDDYKDNNSFYVGNKVSIGNTITVRGPRNIVDKLIIEGCSFRGGTSSSFVASSQTKDCLVKDCTFTGYMADHGVYCSMKVESFLVENCQIENVPHVKGLFKVRTSKHLRHFSIQDVEVHNYNGYLAMVSFLETPEAVVEFNRIKVTKDEGNNSVFYGFCLNDETKRLKGIGYNSAKIILSDCQFEYGYNGNSIIYSGAGSRVCTKEILYDHIVASESNFGGGCSDKIVVTDSRFNACCTEKGIYLCSKELVMRRCNLHNLRSSNCLFLVNYDNTFMRNLSLQYIVIDANTSTIIKIFDGKHLSVQLSGCHFPNSTYNIYKAPKTCKVDYRERE